MLKYSKTNLTKGKYVNFIFSRQLVIFASYYKIVYKLSFYTSVITISRLDFGKVWFLIVFLQTFGLIVIDILIKLKDLSANIKHKDRS